ncbi:MAG: SLBB domain-containing protein, partial [Duncaniella sp.]|nr:SLBB domain-containing protein [Duncaniella sp.]
MKLRSLLLSFLCMTSLMASALTDQEVITYIKQQMAAGKSDQQIGKELMAKGVTPEQAKRIKAQLEAENKSENRSTDVSSSDQQRAHSSSEDISSDAFINIQREIDTDGNGQVSARQIYGHQVFNAQALTFEPSENIATPKNYVLGPGDEVIIDIWGTSEDHLRETISPEGSIMIAQIGPVYLNGKTIDDANRHIRSLFANKYAGVEDAATDVQLTLGQVRTIQVNILGEAATPGTYRMSPFSTVLHALYRAGGISDIGSLRNIQVSRNGRKIADVDIYDFLFNQKSNGNIRLQEGDIIYVPTYDQLVDITGNVKRPMYYEIKPDETVKQVLDFAGGFTGDAYGEMVRLSRQNGTENQLFNIDQAEFDTYRLKDGDIITVGTILDRYANRVEVKGAVYRPGLFAISPDLTTVSDLIRKADGLTDDAYTGRVLLYREGPNLELQVESFDINSILSKQVPDITLRRNDVLVISSINELEQRGELTIAGQVANPGNYPYASNTTIEDLIIQAGGLLDGASTARVEVARRITDPTSMTPTQQLSQIYTLSIEKGLAVGDARSFVLKPYDLVTVFRSPGYAPQEMVEIGGEVLFPG